jgi:hypothetical protein
LVQIQSSPIERQGGAIWLAHQAHNLKVIGSNPILAIKKENNFSKKKKI